ncbi:MAG: indole-3-glycerol phosphate synthase TrpC [Coriobacteriia bacterium]|nr:indole-3-glycerol phosphate synthase TrpC [Coriobacteriia bacterium]
MTNILDRIADATRRRVAQEEAHISLGELKLLCKAAEYGSSKLGQGKRFTDALAKPGLSLICEAKKASPSKGIISPDFPYLAIAHEYEAAGADAISCLTEPEWFLGTDKIFRDIRRSVDAPMLRKDFTVSEYQIYQARLMGADAVLLICSLLDDEHLQSYLELTHELGMAALVEAHDEREVEQALQADARIIGVNNRKLADFSVDFENAGHLRSLVGDDRLFVAESGVSVEQDIARIAHMKADAALVGEALMRSKDRTETLAAFRKAARLDLSRMQETTDPGVRP